MKQGLPKRLVELAESPPARGRGLKLLLVVEGGEGVGRPLRGGVD